ncbi:MAG: ATP-binding cassette domain-containing protein, partial [Deinococcus sp.]|nr:ATP-binding cassette domain-containing protein [Deinococcus sp.]
MIEVKNLSKVFPDGTQALSDISVSVPKGDFVAVIGLSGAGKSTFLRCINRLVEPSGGEVKVGGQEVTRLSLSELQRFRRKVGFIFQQFNLVTRIPVLENVLCGRLGYLPTWRGLLGLFTERDYQVAREQIRRVGLNEKERTRADQLSGGQQQRVAIARALAQEPDIILADE